MYLTYKEYKEYGGTLDESAFNSLYFDAQIKVDYYTFNRLKNDTKISDRVKRCIYRIIDLMATHQEYIKAVTDMKNPIMQSASNDGVSISYGGYLGNTTPQDVEAITEKLQRDILNTIKQYLNGELNEAGESLLYRGVY